MNGFNLQATSSPATSTCSSSPSMQRKACREKKIKCEKDQSSNLEQESHSLLYCNSPLKEVLILSQRFSKNIFRTKQLFTAKTVQSLLAGIVLGTIFINGFGKSNNKKLQNQVGFFAFTLTFLISSTTEALPIFLQERRILMRETSIGAYRISSYILANFLIFLPFLLLVSVLYTSPVYWLIGLRREADGFLYFTLLVWITVLTTNSFVACFAALVFCRRIRYPSVGDSCTRVEGVAEMEQLVLDGEFHDRL
ncbi:hypothetical protein ACS0TY_017388 [Phlomoides rotata]